MLELFGFTAVLASCLYNRFDLAAFAMTLVVYAKVWGMTVQLNRILNRKEDDE